jgi:serine/threonine protein kinase
VHRDLKPENVLVSQNESQIQIKLADFGFASSTHTTPLSTSYKGTKRGYMAPELHALLTAKPAPYNMLKADIFALGVIVFILILGRLPFEYATPTNKHYSLLQQQKYQEFWKIHEQPLSKLAETEGAHLEEFK